MNMTVPPKPLYLSASIICLAIIAYIIYFHKTPKLPNLMEEFYHASTKEKVRLSKVLDKASRPCSTVERLNHLRRVCYKYEHEVSGGKLSLPAEQSIVDHKHHLLLCWMSKAGCTSLKTLLLEANGWNVTANKLSSNLMRVHNRQFLNSYNLETLGNMSYKEVQNVLQRYFKLFTVRHPFERLLSVYRGKVVDADGDGFLAFSALQPLQLFHPEIFKNPNFSHMSQNEIRNNVQPPTFIEFLQWLNYSRKENDHWATVLSSCRPCSHDWDAILRIETMASDKRILLDRLSPDVNNVPVRHSHQDRPAGDHYRIRMSEYSGVPDGVIDYLLERYQIDMEMFGYHWDRSTNTAYCAIRTDQNTTCC